MHEAIRVIGRVEAREGMREELYAALVTLVTHTRREAGCLRYELWEQDDRPGAFAFVEEWATGADLDAHLASAHMADAVAAVGRWADGPPDIRRYRAVR